MTSEIKEQTKGTPHNIEPQCRICLADLSSQFDLTQDEQLWDLASVVRPCMCRGSIEFVHQKCLKRWVFHSQRLTCQVCLYKYKISQQTEPLHKICRRLKKQSQGKNACKILRRRLLEYITWAIMVYMYWCYVQRVMEQAHAQQVFVMPSKNNKTTCETQILGIQNNSRFQKQQQRQSAYQTPEPPSNRTNSTVTNFPGHYFLMVELFVLVFWFTLLVKFGFYVMYNVWNDIHWCKRQRCRRRFLNCNYHYKDKRLLDEQVYFITNF